MNDGQCVQTIAADCADMAALQPPLEAWINTHGVPHCLINCVGYSRPGYVQHFTLEHFRESMEVNYFGQLVPMLILLPHFMAARAGHIANVSSVLGFMGIMGYATYCPTKFAITGLTDCLRNELKPYGITFSVLFPPDVDTPGFAEENRTKPYECAVLSRGARTMTAEAVAEAFVTHLARGTYEIAPGDASFVRRLYRYVPWLARRKLDTDYQKAMAALASQGKAAPPAPAAGTATEPRPD